MAGLTEGTLVTTANRFLDEEAPFDAETLELRLGRPRSRSSAITACRIADVGAAVPVVTLPLDGERTNVYKEVAPAGTRQRGIHRHRGCRRFGRNTRSSGTARKGSPLPLNCAYRPAMPTISAAPAGQRCACRASARWRAVR